MEFIVGLILGITIGFIWGVWRATQSFIERIIERPDEIREIMSKVEKIAEEDRIESKEEPANSNDIRAEFHQGVCYLYDHNDRFLAQGATATEAMTNAERRFPELKLRFRLNEPKESNQ